MPNNGNTVTVQQALDLAVQHHEAGRLSQAENIYRQILGRDSDQPEFKNKKYITSCIFKLKSIPAALYKALGGFATNGVNLCKLESFSVKNTFDQVNFYIDIEGHIEDPSLRKALEELGFHTQKLDVLGVYEAHQFRIKNK